MNLKSRHIVAALALHLLLFGLLLGGAQCSHRPEPVNVIQGTLISASQLPQAQAEPKPQPAAQPPAPEPVPAPPAPPPPDPAEAKRQQEKAAKAIEDRRKQEVLAQQQADAKAAAVKAAELKKQAEAEDKKRAADVAKKQAEADEKKRTDELRKAAEAEDSKRAAEEKKKQALKAQLDAEARRLREAELAQALGAETAQRTAGELSLWGTQVTAALQRVWTRPPGLDQNLKCVINMQLSATGEVLTASVKTSSGNPLYDESVVRAAYKASPLPLPRDPTVFQKSINITFVPRA
ncbi:MAG: hypothetical protein NVS9B10_07960 [Nevskia sp.]